jgi:hypothetical protein
MAKREKIADWLSHNHPNIVLIGTHDGTSEHFNVIRKLIDERIATLRYPAKCVATSLYPKHLLDPGQVRSHKSSLDTIVHQAKKHQDKHLVIVIGEHTPTPAGSMRTLKYLERLLDYHKAYGMKLLITMDPQFAARRTFEERHTHLSSVIGIYEEPVGLSEFAVQVSLMSEHAYLRYVDGELRDETEIQRPYLHGAGAVAVK